MSLAKDTLVHYQQVSQHEVRMETTLAHFRPRLLLLHGVLQVETDVVPQLYAAARPQAGLEI